MNVTSVTQFSGCSWFCVTQKTTFLLPPFVFVVDVIVDCQYSFVSLLLQFRLNCFRIIFEGKVDAHTLFATNLIWWKEKKEREKKTTKGEKKVEKKRKERWRDPFHFRKFSNWILLTLMGFCLIMDLKLFLHTSRLKFHTEEALQHAAAALFDAYWMCKQIH